MGRLDRVWTTHEFWTKTLPNQIGGKSAEVVVGGRGNVSEIGAEES
jgi:hypothetical protein